MIKKKCIIFWDNLNCPYHINESSIIWEAEKTSNSFFCKERVNFKDIDAIIILAELTWNGKKYSDFYGFDIACELRLKHKILIPIVMVSFMPETFFQDNCKYNILKARGTNFLQLPFEPEELVKCASEIRSLSQASLADISSLLLNSRYLIDRFTHDIRFELDKASLKTKANNILADLPDDYKKKLFMG